MALTLSINEHGQPLLLISGHDGAHQYVCERLADTRGIQRWRVFRVGVDAKGVAHDWIVWCDGEEWGCGCPARKHRPWKACKHILTVEEYVQVVPAHAAAAAPPTA